MRVTLSILTLLIGIFTVASTAAAGLEERFLACARSNDGNEESCLDRFGWAAWMPWDDAACNAVAVRIGAVFEAGGLARTPDLFRNERCARLNRPHNEAAAAVGSLDSRDRAYAECHLPDRFIAFYACDDIVGIHMWRPDFDTDCPATAKLTAMQHKNPRNNAFIFLFENERCRRLGQQYFSPDEGGAGKIKRGPD